jgi:hypothetical protein
VLLQSESSDRHWISIKYFRKVESGS